MTLKLSTQTAVFAQAFLSLLMGQSLAFAQSVAEPSTAAPPSSAAATETADTSKTRTEVGPSYLPGGPYLYEKKPDDPDYEKFFPRKAPPLPEQPLIRQGDRLAIIGDSITEQKMYSRIIETYLTACLPQLQIQTRQLGWSGETAEGFLRRIDQDCLRFDPTIATLCYGMNDTKYRPFDFNNGRWYHDHYGEIARRLKAAGARVIVGSPGCAGKIAKWTRTKAGTLDEHNLNLCALRDIGIEISREQKVGFADIFWPMFQAQIEAPKRHGTADRPYDVAGRDGIHPGWSGHTIMAYAFLTSMGLSGELAHFHVDLQRRSLTVSPGHELVNTSPDRWTIRSTRYPFCATGDIHDDNTIRSGMTLVPFNENLNRWTLIVSGMTEPMAMVQWGDQSQRFTRAELAAGVNLADRFEVNPFSAGFEQVDAAVAAKQAFETEQIKKIFHGQRGRTDLAAAVAETEAKRDDLVQEIQSAMRPITHTLSIQPISP